MEEHYLRNASGGSALLPQHNSPHTRERSSGDTDPPKLKTPSDEVAANDIQRRTGTDISLRLVRHTIE